MCTLTKEETKEDSQIQTFSFVLSARASSLISGGASVTLQMLEMFLDSKT